MPGPVPVTIVTISAGCHHHPHRRRPRRDGPEANNYFAGQISLGSVQTRVSSVLCLCHPRYPDSHVESGGWEDDLNLVPENDNVSLKLLLSSDKLIDHVSGPSGH